MAGTFRNDTWYLNKITAKDPRPPQCFLYLRETKSWWCEGEGDGGGEEKVSMLTHATTRGVGKNYTWYLKNNIWYHKNYTLTVSLLKDQGGLKIQYISVQYNMPHLNYSANY